MIFMVNILVLYQNSRLPLTCKYTQWGWKETQVACRTVCDHFMTGINCFSNRSDSNVTPECHHQMGYDFGVPLPGGFHGVQHESFTPSMVYSNISCNGTEDSIWDCSMDIDDGSNTECCTSCYHKSVAVYCSRFC